MPSGMADARLSSIRRDPSPTTICSMRRRAWRRQLLSGARRLDEERVAFLVTPGFPWVAVQWGIWRAGGVAVPLPLNSPRSELEYFIDDSKASTLVFDALAETVLSPIAAARGIRALSCNQATACEPAELPDIASERRAMILYTSGTTSRPKGVVTTHTPTLRRKS
jgi:malonyl-CoA/methylmalonyl-CoA synthetase